ncbi:glycosyltransferase [Guyparkeria halophila]|uniref:Glycosyltransferase n=1 Tax=Guyparkeria halophila TaxID=47960 RepID=A0ABZ0YV64_9GAMM|nr:glycosyltransferase [Guyparkeria halophila]WQH16066.1 glycosyltransferase [Guyparkeria halophila]
MATTPYFVLSPSAALSIIGLIRGPDKTDPTPPEDWRDAVVDVVIPALNEQASVVLALESVRRQTKQPRNIILVDDGSRDRTIEYARAFAEHHDMPLTVIQRDHPIGKTPTIKRQSREYDADVEFILDADTYLDADNYIARTVEELYKGAGIASACGVILPTREKDRRRRINEPAISAFLDAKEEVDLHQPLGNWWHRLNRNLTAVYRQQLYTFLQRFVYVGQMKFFGSITNPVGCAVAYRRKFIKDLFDKYEPVMGDDLTNSEDIFIGFALMNEGYRNIQLQDVTAHSMEPEMRNLPRQIYMWSSSFLQSCYYFDGLLGSPFKVLRRIRKRYREKHDAEVRKLVAQRKIREPYRQPFGVVYTEEQGRPAGWIPFLAAFEKVAFPTALLIMILLQLWEPLVVTLIAEMIVAVGILTYISKGRRFKAFLQGILMTPIRYASLLYDLVTIGRFATDLWITGNRKWHK